MPRRTSIAICIALTLACLGCSTTSSRIRARQEAFDAYPASVQQNLRAGIIEVGYSAEMVIIALGEPDQKVDVATGEVAAQVWTWWRNSPGVTLSLGSWSPLGSRVGLGTGMSLGEGARREETAVVELRSGRVHRFEKLAPR